MTLGEIRLLASYPELDHYGQRQEAQFIGPLLGKLKRPTVQWPESSGPRVFACLRANTRNVLSIITGLGDLEASIICVVNGLSQAQLQPLRKTNIHVAPGAVDLEPLLDAQLCLSYGAEGTMLTFLRAGVAQLISPWHVEAHMAARRVEAAGLGRVIPESAHESVIRDTIGKHALEQPHRANAESFGKRASLIRPEDSVTEVISAIEGFRAGAASAVA